jgi:hypothetical protein
VRFTSPFGTYDLDGTNIGHAVRLLGHRTARAEHAAEVLLVLRPLDEMAITDYLLRADRVVVELAAANTAINGWLDSTVLESYLEGFNTAVRRDNSEEYPDHA